VEAAVTAPGDQGLRAGRGERGEGRVVRRADRVLGRTQRTRIRGAEGEEVFDHDA
jgi:hypothetical protein